MACGEVRTRIDEYVRRRLPERDAAALRGHLAVCAGCAAAYEAEIALATALRSQAEPVPPRVLSGVMAAVRTQPRARPAFGVRPADVVLAAGLALAVAGVLLGTLWLQALFLPLGETFLDAGARLYSERIATEVARTLAWTAIGGAISLGLATVVLTLRGLR
jgi:anti-sigma factor RsiW